MIKVSFKVAIGVFPGMNLNSSAGYPVTEVHVRSNKAHGDDLSKAVLAGP